MVIIGQDVETIQNNAFRNGYEKHEVLESVDFIQSIKLVTM